MSHNERYKNAEKFDLAAGLLDIRKHIGELPDFRSPSQSQIELAVEEIFPHLLTHEKVKLIEAFIKSEDTGAGQADQHANEKAA